MESLSKSTDPVLNEEYCFMIYIACTTPPLIFSNFYRTIGVFCLKFLYHSFTSRGCCVLLKRRVTVSIERRTNREILVAGEVEKLIQVRAASLNNLTLSLNQLCPELSVDDVSKLYGYMNVCLDHSFLVKASKILDERSRSSLFGPDHVRDVASARSSYNGGGEDNAGRSPSGAGGDDLYGRVILRTAEYEERFSFRPMSLRGAEWMAAHPIGIRTITTVLILLYILILFLPISSDFDCYWQYSAMIAIGIVLILIGAAGTDLNVFLIVVKKFDFLYPMLLMLLMEVVKRTVLYRRGYSSLAVAISAIYSLVGMGIWTFVFSCDAAVHRPIMLTRISLGLVAVYFLVASAVEGFADYSNDPIMKEQFCLLIVVGCQTPQQIYTSFYRTVGLFLCKFLYISIRHPHSLLMINRKIAVIHS